jgi:hypothetical protein
VAKTIGAKGYSMVDRDIQIRKDTDAFRESCVDSPHISWSGFPFIAPNQILPVILQLIATYTDFEEDAIFGDFGTVLVDGRSYHWDIFCVSANGRTIDPMREDVAYRRIVITPE